MRAFAQAPDSIGFANSREWPHNPAMERGRILADRMLDWAGWITFGNAALAICAFWTGAIPAILIYGVSAATTLAALVILSFRSLPRHWRSKEQLGFSRNRDLLVNQVRRPGLNNVAFGFSFLCFAAAFLSGFRFPQLALIFAAFLLTAVWSAATYAWPADREN